MISLDSVCNASPIQRHIDNVAVLLSDVPFRIRPTTAWSGLRTDCRSNIRKGQTHVFLYLAVDIDLAAFDTAGQARQRSDPFATARLRASDALATDRTGCGATKPLLLQSQRVKVWLLMEVGLYL